MDSNKKRLNTTQKVTIILVLSLLLVTFLSKTFYNMNIPVVHIATPIPGNITNTYETFGVIMPKTIIKIFAPEPLRVKEIFPKAGRTLKKGEPLIALDTAELEYELERLELNYEKLKIQLKKTSNDDDNKLVNLEIDDTLKSIVNMKEKIEECKQLVTPEWGTVMEINVTPGQIADRSQPLMVLGNRDDGLEAIVQIPADKAYLIKQGSGSQGYAETAIKIISGSSFIEGKAGAKRTLADGNIEVQIEMGANYFKLGEFVEIEISNTTTKYSTVVPSRAIRKDENNAYVFVCEQKDGPLGEETVLRKVLVRLVAINEENAAISSGEIDENSRIVVSSDKEISGGRVKLFKQ